MQKITKLLPNTDEEEQRAIQVNWKLLGKKVAKGAAVLTLGVLIGLTMAAVSDCECETSTETTDDETPSE